MCGICGQFNFRTNKPVSRSDIKRMTSTIVHRGPDDEGYYFSGPLGFGFRRLSIIDLAGGHQPAPAAQQHTRREARIGPRGPLQHAPGSQRHPLQQGGDDRQLYRDRQVGRDDDAGRRPAFPGPVRPGRS